MAEKFLVDLPSRGCFTVAFAPSNFDCVKPYICDHDTAPPEDQVIKTDPTNILIRSLEMNKAKKEHKLKDKRKSVADNGRGKRPANKPLDDKPAAKRANLSTSPASSKKGKQNILTRDLSRQNKGGSNRLSDKDLQSCTVDKLRSLLKERGLPTKGKKDELIARLR